MILPDEKAKYFLVGEELYLENGDLGARLVTLDDTTFDSLDTSEDVSMGLRRLNTPTPSRDVMFKFGRMFRRPNLPEYRPDAADLVSLGSQMRQINDPGPNLNLPAGYTFLGQFIDHDISFDVSNLSTGMMAAEDTKNKRSPSLDLDSLYGYNPDIIKRTPIGKVMYEANGIRLRVGETQGDPFIADPQAQKSFPHDLPRGFDKGQLKAAAIGDPRNDENLATAQTHLAFIKFHNAVVNFLEGQNVPPESLFDAAREQVTRHYQWIILFDYLNKIVEQSVLLDVIENGCKHFIVGSNEAAFMPIEFSVAAFRLGHSQVTEVYDWNRDFQAAGSKRGAKLRHLFAFTGFGNGDLLGQPQLLSSWIIDWTRFYDFRKFPDVKGSSHRNQARKFDPTLTPGLMDLPVTLGDPDIQRSLPVRNLLRGRLLGVPTGQSIAERLGGEEVLQAKDFEDEPIYPILKQLGYDRLTPLWYYILKEAKRFHGGERLGPVGSRILAETFVGLIKRSRISILPVNKPGKPTWKPELPPGNDDFSMTDLLYFVQRYGSDGDFLNPLGDDNQQGTGHQVLAEKPNPTPPIWAE